MIDDTSLSLSSNAIKILADNGIANEYIRCPRCMDDEKLSNVIVFWTTQVEGGKVLKCACDRGHEFTHEVIGDITDSN